jgi:DNA-binding CsgD family transcriptional regulator
MSKSPITLELLSLAGDLYEGVHDAALLTPALARLNRMFDATFLQLLSRDCVGGGVLQCVTLVDGVPVPPDNFLVHWSSADPRAALLDAAPPQEAWRCHLHLDEAVVAGDTFYQQAMLPFGLRWTLAATVKLPTQSALLSLSRPASAAPFSTDEAAAFSALLPHLQRSLGLRGEFDRLRSAVDSASEGIRHVTMPCVITDEAGRCIESNQAFDHLASTLGLQKVVGRLRFQDRHVQTRLESALRDTHMTALRQEMAFRGADQTRWAVQLVPWRTIEQGPDQPVRGLILAMFEPEMTPRAAPDHVAAITYTSSKLTHAENEVLAGMLRGLPAKAIATQRNSSYNTVRAQIVSILDKTGFSSQKELMAHLGNSQWSESVFSASLNPPSSQSAPRSPSHGAPN